MEIKYDDDGDDELLFYISESTWSRFFHINDSVVLPQFHSRVLKP